MNLPFTHDDYAAILVGAVLISALGAIDDGVDGVSPPLKFLGQAGCAISRCRRASRSTTSRCRSSTPSRWARPVPDHGRVHRGGRQHRQLRRRHGRPRGRPLPDLGRHLLHLALSLDRFAAATLAAAVAGACLGFLPWNFHPAKIFMGDAGSLPLGFLLASMSITGVMKTAAALALVFPLIVLLVPILDTSFVILKRLKYSQSVTVADRNHLHHRMLRVGYSQRQAALLLYGWCLVLAAFALAVRFLHYKHPNGSIDLTGTVALSAVRARGAAASAFVVYELEIIKYRHLRMIGIARNTEAEDDVPLGHRPAPPARGCDRLTGAARAARCYVAKARIWRSTSHPCTSIPSPISCRAHRRAADAGAPVPARGARGDRAARSPGVTTCGSR